MDQGIGNTPVQHADTHISDNSISGNSSAIQVTNDPAGTNSSSSDNSATIQETNEINPEKSADVLESNAIAEILSGFVHDIEEFQSDTSEVITNYFDHLENDIFANFFSPDENEEKLAEDGSETPTNIIDDCFKTSDKPSEEPGMASFQSVTYHPTIEECDIQKVMIKAKENHFEAIGDDSQIFNTCSILFRRDYNIINCENWCGALCWNYPENIIIPRTFKKRDLNSSNSEGPDIQNTDVPGFIEKFEDYKHMAVHSAIGRCRCRFPVPVILYNRKYICRSGTVADVKAAAFEAARSSAGSQNKSILDSHITRLVEWGKCFVGSKYKSLTLLKKGLMEQKNADKEVLEKLKISYICDLMVEDCKEKYLTRVSSSEKADEEYKSFPILKIPYPGCEFFREYSAMKSSENYEEEKKSLLFDWNAAEINSSLGLTTGELPKLGNIEWNEYRVWDLETLTKNYMLLLLHYLQKDDGGLLVHCISGWDRTPLFICLLRISLWADNLIHKELNITEMAYLTLAYDWYLFGHDLPNRISKGEEIMHFCFKFIPQMASEEFSLKQSLASDDSLKTCSIHSEKSENSDISLIGNNTSDISIISASEVEEIKTANVCTEEMSQSRNSNSSWVIDSENIEGIEKIQSGDKNLQSSKAILIAGAKSGNPDDQKIGGIEKIQSDVSNLQSSEVIPTGDAESGNLDDEKIQSGHVNPQSSEVIQISDAKSGIPEVVCSVDETSNSSTLSLNESSENPERIRHSTMNERSNRLERISELLLRIYDKKLD